MTISEELREWATCGPDHFFLLSGEAFSAMAPYKNFNEWILDLPTDDRRTFALLVAEAIDDDMLRREGRK